MVESPIHTGSDGRGARDVFLNGRLVKDALYANTRKGIVRVVVRDSSGNIRMDKYRKRVLTRTLHGKVVVKQKVLDEQ